MSDGPIMVELPPGSGRVALYDEGERRMMRDIVAAAETAGDARLSQLEVLHDLKIEFGLNLVTDQVCDVPVAPVEDGVV